MSYTCTLENKFVKNTLNSLHLDAKGDWKIVLRTAPNMIAGMLRGKSMMESLSPSMLKDAYMPVSKEQGELLYSLARSSGAKNIVEFGSSFGIGTIYLAAAAKDNGGQVVTTEIEPIKCQVTRENLKKANVEDIAKVLEGDALKTLKTIDHPVDFVFLDGWKDLYNSVLDVLLPKLEPGAIVIADNIDLSDAKLYMDRVTGPNSGFVTTIVNKATALSCYVGTK